MASHLSRFKLIPAVFILLRKGDQVLLLRRKDTGYMDGFCSLPAGHVDGGEPAIQAAIREAREEIGIDLMPKDLHLVHTMHHLSKIPEPHERLNLYFEAHTWTGRLHNVEPNKCSELKWVPLSNLPNEVLPDIRRVLTLIAKGKSYSHFGF